MKILVTILSFFICVVCFSQQLDENAQVTMGDYKIESFPKNSEKRYKALISLLKTVASKKDNGGAMFGKKMPEGYINYVNEAYNYAIAQQKNEDLNLIKNQEFDHYLYYKPEIEIVVLANRDLNGTIPLSDSFTYELYSYLNLTYPRLGMNAEFIENLPKLYALKKKLKLADFAAVNKYGNVANGYYLNKQYHDAIGYWYKAFNYNKGKKRLLLASSLQNNIGLSFGKLNQSDSAQTHFDKAIILAEKSNPKFENWDVPYRDYFVQTIKANKAKLLWLKSDPERVIPFIKKELKKQIPVALGYELVTNYNLLGELYYQIGDIKKALKYLKIGEKYLKVNVNAKDHIKNMSLLAQIYFVLGDTKKGTVLFTKRDRFQDSVSTTLNNMRSAIALASFDTKQKENQILVQKKEIEYQKKSQQIFYISLFILCVLLVVIIIYTLKIKKKNSQITVQKKALDNSLQQKEVLLKEVHHRVKNNLQIISGLLRKQEISSENKIVKKVMAEGQARVQSMALIHQHLYENDDLKEIDLAKYTESLIKNIKISNLNNKKKVSYKITIPKILVTIDIAVPYGLIITELISNIYKYAFKNRDNGTYSITIEIERENYFKLIVHDNGIGLPKDIKERIEKSLGFNLIKGLAWQLRGSLSYFSDASGSTFVVLFSNDLINDV